MFELNNYVQRISEKHKSESCIVIEMPEKHKSESSMILERKTAPLRGIWKGKLTGKEINEGIKEIRAKWRMDTQ